MQVSVRTHTLRLVPRLLCVLKHRCLVTCSFLRETSTALKTAAQPIFSGFWKQNDCTLLYLNIAATAGADEWLIIFIIFFNPPFFLWLFPLKSGRILQIKHVASPPDTKAAADIHRGPIETPRESRYRDRDESDGMKGVEEEEDKWGTRETRKPRRESRGGRQKRQAD